jgi:hypothetical protein
MNVTRAGDGTITITVPPGEVEGLEDELLWVKNVDDDGPLRKLSQALSDLADAGEPAADPDVAALVSAVEAHGWTVRFVDYCEDARTPGLLGQIAGVTDWERREVKIGLKATSEDGQRVTTLLHELKHIVDPDWDCGNRDVFGRGGPANRKD